jgi:hypothetical protein
MITTFATLQIYNNLIIKKKDFFSCTFSLLLLILLKNIWGA